MPIRGRKKINLLGLVVVAFVVESWERLLRNGAPGVRSPEWIRIEDAVEKLKAIARMVVPAVEELLSVAAQC